MKTCDDLSFKVLTSGRPWYNVSGMNGGMVLMDREKQVVGIVEDDEQMCAEVADLLKKYGYGTAFYTDYEHIAEEIGQDTPDILLLDVNLPYKDGYEICREIRRKYAFPIIMLTAQDSAMDEVMALKCGADDFIAKPYHPQVLAAHIETVARRASRQPAGNMVTHKGVTLNMASAVISYQDKSAELTRNELKILYALMRKPDRIVAREEIMNDLWQEGQFIDENTLNVNVGRLRKKLADIGAADYLETKRGMGYKV